MFKGISSRKFKSVEFKTYIILNVYIMIYINALVGRELIQKVLWIPKFINLQIW